jgi:chemotaxis protein methyltransferase CheR
MSDLSATRLASTQSGPPSVSSSGTGAAGDTGAGKPGGGEPSQGQKAVPSLGYGDYMRFSELAHARFGLSFPERRRADLERGIRQAFAASTCADLNEYYRLLQDESKGVVERERLVNALTVSETHFLRNAGHFDALFAHVLPQIIERRRTLRTLRIWSAGCASGEEPYSIAMMLRILLPDVDEWSITILGTDINTESLDRARKGLFGQWAFREERAKQWRPQFFRLRGKRYELAESVRNMVSFAQLNLKDDSYPAYETNTTLMDLILCRNVTIYFSEHVTRQIVNRFYEALVDGGWLVVGHSEHTLGTYRRFQARTFPGAILYQRTGQPTPWPQDWDWLVGSPPQVAQITQAPGVAAVHEPLGERTAVSLPTAQATQPALVAEPPSDPERETEDPVERAAELIEYGHSVQARELLIETSKQRPDHEPIYTLLGQACANLGHWEEAGQWCQRAISLNRLALKAYYTLALVLQHQGNLEEAINAMKKVVYIDRNNILGHFGLADLYRCKEQLPQALKSLDNARRLLSTRVEEELIPDSGGITAGRLRQTVIRQQQQWEAEASKHTAI